ncbi:MerR family DNA-binding transcriptional regulator, partial [Candidatus Daviesbacteria bacterium]|nr:MerR family DNA-binding transcriptional regulator [Candidatus Daviesbacteria bacterium]
MLKVNSSKKSLVKIAQASKLLGVHKDTLRRWEKAGKIKVVRDQKGDRLYDVSKLINSAPASQTSKVPTTEQLLKSASQHAQQSTLQPQLPALDYSALLDQTISKDNKQTGRRFYFMAAGFFLLLVLIGLGYIRVLSTQSKPQIITSLENKILAAITSQPLVKINADVKVRGSLSVSNDINGLAIATDSAGFTLTSENGKLTVVGDALLNQDLSSSGSPTFSSLNLSSTSNQLVFQSGGPAGTLTWTPTAARTITLPDTTTTLVGKDTTDTFTNKSISGSSNTFTNIPNSALTNKKITVTAGTNLTGGGDVELGSSITLSLKESPTFSGVVLLSDGTAAAPGLAFSNDTNTGLYRIGTDKIALITGGLATSGITIDSSGNLGIANNSPAYKLDVTGTANITSNTTIGGTLGVTGISTFSSTMGVSSGLSVGSTYSSLSPPTSGAIIEGNVGIGTSAPGSFALNVSGNTYLNGRLETSGNVGIANSAPSFTLDVVGTGRFSSLLNVLGNIGIGTSGAAGSALQVNGGGLFGWGTTSTALSSGAILGVNGNVGVGTTSPLANLHV